MAAQYEEIFLIDGYNLLLRGFTYLNGEGLQAAREKLEVRLREFQKVMGPHTRIIIVYDGTDMIFNRPSKPDPSFQMIFSHPPETADEVILKEYRRLQGSGSVVVVSSDRKDIGKKLHGLKVRFLASEEFAGLMDTAMQRHPGKPPSPTIPAAEKPSPEEISSQEVEEWVKIFSQPKERKSPRSSRKKKP